MVDVLFKFSKLLDDVVGLIKIVEEIEVEGLDKSLRGPLHHGNLYKHGHKGKKRKDFGQGK